MSFIEKETALISKMKEDGYNTLFNGDEDEAMKYVTTHFLSIADYVMGHTENNINSLIEEKDSGNEEAIHNGIALYNAATTGITAINRLSNMLGMGNLFDVDLEDAAATKKFDADTVMEIYREAIAGTHTE